MVTVFITSNVGNRRIVSFHLVPSTIERFDDGISRNERELARSRRDTAVLGISIPGRGHDY